MLKLLQARLRDRHVPPGIASLVPRCVKGFSLPRGYGSALREVPQAGGRILASEPTETIPLPAPVRHGVSDSEDLANFTASAPANHVFELSDATLRGGDGHIVTRDQRLIFDSGFWGRSRPTRSRPHTFSAAKTASRSPPSRHRDFPGNRLRMRRLRPLRS